MKNEVIKNKSLNSKSMPFLADGLEKFFEKQSTDFQEKSNRFKKVRKLYFKWFVGLVGVNVLLLLIFSISGIFGLWPNIRINDWFTWEYNLVNFAILAFVAGLTGYTTRKIKKYSDLAALSIHRKNISNTLNNYLSSNNYQEDDLRSKLISLGVEYMFRHLLTGFGQENDNDFSSIETYINSLFRDRNIPEGEGIISLDCSNIKSFMSETALEDWKHRVKEASEMLHKKTGAGSDYTGWVDWPVNYDKEEFERIKSAAEKIRNNSEVLVVIGIGGSYLGARAVIEALSHGFYNLLSKDKRKGPEIYFAGNDISGKRLKDLLEMLGDKDVSLNVISKSGTTTEPALAFRVLREFMEKKYGKEAAKRIYVTTDKSKGTLKDLAIRKGYETFVVPDDLGGRYSVLSAVGLLPIAVSGINIDNLMQGAAVARETYANDDLEKNDCYKYAVLRNIFYQQNKAIEILVNYDPRLHFFGEWWKQLFGESEGKDKKGIFPATVDFTTDLHSMGQFIQDGSRNMFETVLWVEEEDDFVISEDKENTDGLNFLSGKTFDYVNRKAMEGTVLAHVDGGVPNLIIKIKKLDEFALGGLIYFFEKACGISGYLLGVNPFDQPGVEAYKKNMFALLGKPGYEEEKSKLENRLRT